MDLRSRRRALLAALTAVLIPAVMCAPVAVQSQPPQPPQPARAVLAIHWGAEDFPGTAALDAAIQGALRSGSDEPINYFAEYLESEAFPSSLLPLRDYIAQKYAGRRIDLVLAITTPALTFALSHRDRLFPDAPIVFLAGSIPPEMADRKTAASTGIVSDVTWAETLELALTLNPSLRRVFVVAQAPVVEEYEARVQAALQPFSRRVELTFVHEKTVPALLAAVRAIPAGSAILYTRYTPEDSFSVANTVEVARLLARTSPVPVYGSASVYMGTGIVGGMMRDSAATGGRIGEMARRILDGTRPEDIPIEKAVRMPIFDWRQLERWGIDPDRLPQGSGVQFRTPTRWEAYRWYIVGTIVVVTGQLVLIAGLLTQHARRRRAEATIRAREGTVRMSYRRIRQLAGRLIHAQEAARASIARDLHDDVCQQLVYVTMGVHALKSSFGSIQDRQTQQTLADLDREINRVFDSLRRLSHELHPATLRWLGLAPALKAHCLEVEQRHGVHVNFTTEGGVGKLHPAVAVSIFRIAQESLRNGIVHGRARRFDVSVARSGDQVELTVADDGCGFDVEAVRRQDGGLGLVSIEERAHVIGGEVQIDGAPGRGTTVYVRAPAEPHIESDPDDARWFVDPAALPMAELPPAPEVTHGRRG